MTKLWTLVTKDLSLHLPYFLVLLLIDNWWLPLTYIAARRAEDLELGHGWVMSEMLDYQPTTMVFYGFFFLLWGYHSFEREWSSGSAVWMRGFPIRDQTVVFVKMAVGGLLVGIIRLVDYVLSIVIVETLEGFPVSIPGDAGHFLQVKATAATVYLWWFLLGVALAQRNVRRRLVLTVAVSAWGIVMLLMFGLMAASVVTESPRFLSFTIDIGRYPAEVSLAHVVGCGVFALAALRQCASRQIA